MSVEKKKILRDEKANRSALDTALLSRQLGASFDPTGKTTTNPDPKVLGYKDTSGNMTYYNPEDGDASFSTLFLTGYSESGFLTVDASGVVSISQGQGPGGGGSNIGSWKYTTSLVPASATAGYWVSDNSQPAFATSLFINSIDANGTDWSALLTLLADGGSIILQSSVDVNIYFTYIISGSPVITGDIYTFTVTVGASSGLGAPTNDALCLGYLNNNTGVSTASGCCGGNGSCASRPTGPTLNMMYFDTDYGHAVWWSGTEWVNATGAECPCEPLTVTATSDSYVSITPSGVKEYATGGDSDPYSYYNVASGYTFAGFVVDGFNQGPNVPNYTFTNIQTNHTISATSQAVAFAATLTFTDSTTATVPTVDFAGKRALSVFAVNDVLTANGKSRSDVIKCVFNPAADLEVTAGYVLEQFINLENTEDLVIPTTIETVSQGAFREWENMEYGVDFGATTTLTQISSLSFSKWFSANMSTRLIIPASVNVIGSNAFWRWDSMEQDLEFKSVTPPVIGNNAFYEWAYADSNYGGIRVHVPIGAILSVWKTALSDTSTPSIVSINGILWGNI